MRKPIRLALVRCPVAASPQGRKFLQGNPHCVECKKAGHTQRAQYLDHITPHKGDPALFWNTANWQPLCFHHHNAARMTPK